MRVPTEVLEVLEDDRVTVDGPLLRIAVELPRPLYEKVAKALVAAGGRWDGSKAVRAHRFDQPAAQVLDRLRTGTYVTAKEKGFVPTPPEVASDLLTYVDVGPGDTVLEPSAGTGALVNALAFTGATVDMVEVDRDHEAALHQLQREGLARALTIADFLSLTPPDSGALFDPHGGELYDAVVMNPPFAQQAHHVLHAWKWVKPGGHLAAIVSAGVTFRTDGPYRQLRDLIDGHGEIADVLPEDAFKNSGVGVRPVIVHLGK